MHFHPADCVWDRFRGRRFLLAQLVVDVVFRQVQKLSMARQLFDIVVHGRNVSTKQLIDTTVRVALEKRKRCEYETTLKLESS